MSHKPSEPANCQWWLGFGDASATWTRRRECLLQGLDEDQQPLRERQRGWRWRSHDVTRKRKALAKIEEDPDEELDRQRDRDQSHTMLRSTRRKNESVCCARQDDGERSSTTRRYLGQDRLEVANLGKSCFAGRRGRDDAVCPCVNFEPVPEPRAQRTPTPKSKILWAWQAEARSLPVAHDHLPLWHCRSTPKPTTRH